MLGGCICILQKELFIALLFLKYVVMLYVLKNKEYINDLIYHYIMVTDKTLAKLHAEINDIAGNYFYDGSQELVVRESGPNETVDNWRLLMGSLAYLKSDNVILFGNPGAAKTTFSSIIGSTYTGLPFALFDTLKITGSPEQTKETMLARPDLGRLAEEGVNFQASMYLPLVVVDEINRLPGGKQDILLEPIRTGVVEHFGKWLALRKKPAFFATLNYNGPGTYDLASPLMKRFGIGLDLPVHRSFEQDEILKRADRIERELHDPKRTIAIARALTDRETKPDDKLEMIASEMNPPISDEEVRELTQAASGLRWSPGATTFLRCLYDEATFTYHYGENRPEDLQDTDGRNSKFMSAQIREGLSNRAWRSLKDYSSLLALCTGAEQVELGHVQTVAPTCIAHRLDFAQNKQSDANKVREHDESLRYARTRKCVASVKANYDEIMGPLHNADAFLQGVSWEGARDWAMKNDAPDHPTLKAYWQEVRDRLGGGV